MTIDQPIETLLREIYSMDRQQCMRELTEFRAIPLDFDAEFLEAKTVEWLQHVLAAAVLTLRKRGCAA